MRNFILVFWIFIFSDSAFSQGEKVFLNTINSSDNLVENIGYILYPDLELNDTEFDFRIVHFYRHKRYAYSYVLNVSASNSHYLPILSENLLYNQYSQNPPVLLIINENFTDKKESFIMYGNPDLEDAAHNNDMIGSKRRIYLRFSTIELHRQGKKKK